MKKALFVIFLIGLSACGGRPQSAKQLENQNKISSGIVGGNIVENSDDSKAFLVMIVNTDVGEICTGTLISKNAILTAAHCLKSGPEAIQIYFGTRPFTDETTPVRNVSAAFIHPEYHGSEGLGPTKPGNDLGILSFSGPLPQGYHPIAYQSQSTLEQKMEIVATGFGRDNGLVNDESIEVHGEGTLRQVKTEISVLNDQVGLFLVSQKLGKGVCPGDSGGPALVKKDHEWTVVGVASALILYGNSRAVSYDYCKQTALYMQTSFYHLWIQDVLDQIARNQRGGVQ